MSSISSVALVGATGNLGSEVLEKLLAAGFAVTILTRQGSTSTSKLPSHPKQTIKEVDYSSKDSLVAALKGVDGVVSTVTSSQTGDQDLLIDSAIAAGTVKRFIPSEFGSDIFHPKNKDVPVYKGKIAMTEYIENAAAKNPGFTYTSIQNNAFYDWGLRTGFILDVKGHKGTLYDGGDRPFSTTTLATVADAVVAVFQNPDATANKTIKIRDGVTTQNKIIEVVKKLDGKEWTTSSETTENAERDAYAELKKDQPNHMKAMILMLMAVLFGEGRDFVTSESELDNKLLGLKEKSDAEMEDVIKRVLQE